MHLPSTSTAGAVSWRKAASVFPAPGTARAFLAHGCRRCGELASSRSAAEVISTHSPVRRQRTAPWLARSVSTASNATVDDHLDVRLRSQEELYALTGIKRRMTVSNRNTAKKMVKAMKLDEAKKPMTVIELYAGQGTLTKALLNHPNVERVIAIEHAPRYATEIEKLVGAYAGRLDHVALDPFWWDTYTLMRQRGLLSNFEPRAWEDEPPALMITGMIPDSHNGERLLFQQLSCIPGQIWLYDFGRIPMFMLIGQPFRERMTSPAGSRKRSKLGVLLEQNVQIEQIMPEEDFLPRDKHFQSYRRLTSAHDYSLVRFEPRLERGTPTQVDLEVLDFLARSLMMNKSVPWIQALKYCAPGADIINTILLKQGILIPPQTPPSQLTAAQWLQIVQAFKVWPFRPTDLDHSDVEVMAEGGKSGAKKM